MEWNSNTRFLPPSDSSLTFLYNYTHIPYPGMEGKQEMLTERSPEMEKMEKKKRLTSEQVESLESSFQKEIKLDPHRKMKLSKELGLHPRQIAVWFQNRRARWKAKQLEHLYDSLKQDFDVVSKEKQQLQEQVMKLKAMLREQASTAGYTEMSGEETVESTSEALRCSNMIIHHHHQQQQQQQKKKNTHAAEGNCCFTMEEDYHNNNTTTTTTVPVLPYWPAPLPYYP